MLTESKIDIIIVNWNTGEFLNKCLDSIKKYGGDQISSTTVVDNNSDDSSHNCVQNYENVTLINLTKNLGFAKACNVGAMNSKGKYYLFLNPDTRLEKDTIRKVVHFMELESSKNIGICGVQLYDDSDLPTYSCCRFPSLSNHFFYATGLSKFFPNLGAPMREWEHTDSRKVDQVMGAFFFIRAKLFIDLKGFDERFFIYYEEVDISYRARLRNCKSFFLSDARAYHFGGGSSRNVKAKRIFYSQRSRILYAFKHYSVLSCFFTIIISLFIEPISRILFSLLNFSMKGFTEGLKAYIMLAVWAPNLVKKEYRNS